MRKEVIGDATLYCGDCYEILPGLGLSEIDMLLTDPPYGCTENAWDTTIDLQGFWQMTWQQLKENAACCIFSQMPFSAELLLSQKSLFRYDLIFQKEKVVGFLNANLMPLRVHEIILVFYRKLPVYNPQKFKKETPSFRGMGIRYSDNYGRFKEMTTGSLDGSRFPTSVVCPHAEPDFFKKTEYKKHPTQKPVPIISWLIKTYTDPQQTILDPFMGAGSTGVAALKCTRKFIGVEKEEKYFDTACYRIEKAYQETRLLELANAPYPMPRCSQQCPLEGAQ